MLFKHGRENDILSTPNDFPAANIQSNLKLLCKIHEKKRLDPMQGGDKYFYDTTFRTQQPEHIFL